MYDPQEQNFDQLNLENQPYDNQYREMLPKEKKKSSNSYFLSAPKYEGTNEISQESQEEVNMMQNGIKQAFHELKNERKSRSKLLDEEFKEIQEQDNENILSLQRQTDEDGNTLHLKNQLHEQSKLVELRHFSQKGLEEIKKFPHDNIPISSELNKSSKETEKQILKNLQKLIHNYHSLSKKTFSTDSPQINFQQLLKYKHYQKYKVDSERLWQQFQNQTKFTNKQLQDEILKWSQKTILLRTKGQYSSLLMQTPIGQTKKIMKDWKRVSGKAKQKRSIFKILFKQKANLTEHSDDQIYDDVDYYHQIEKLYQKQLQTYDKDDFRINDTLRHIQQRKNRSVVHKSVDRRASKNRKLRFGVHTKLLNFMPCQNDNTIESRNQIVENMFNSKTLKCSEQIDYIDI